MCRPSSTGCREPEACAAPSSRSDAAAMMRRTVRWRRQACERVFGDYLPRQVVWILPPSKVEWQNLSGCGGPIGRPPRLAARPMHQIHLRALSGGSACQTACEGRLKQVEPAIAPRQLRRTGSLEIDAGTGSGQPVSIHGRHRAVRRGGTDGGENICGGSGRSWSGTAGLCGNSRPGRPARYSIRRSIHKAR